MKNKGIILLLLLFQGYCDQINTVIQAYTNMLSSTDKRLYHQSYDSVMTETKEEVEEDTAILTVYEPNLLSKEPKTAFSTKNFLSNPSPLKIQVNAYIGSWRDYSEVVSIDVSLIDTLIYSSFDADINQLTCTLDRAESEKINKGSKSTFEALKQLKLKKPELKLIASIGGWQNSPKFYDILYQKNKATSKKFIKNCVSAIYSYKIFDGVDINIEFPCPEGEICREDFTEPGRNDGKKTTEIVKLFKKYLGPDYKIILSTSAATKLASVLDFPQLNKIVDEYNVMTYDLISRRGRQTGHVSATFSSLSNPTSWDSVTEFYLNTLKVPASKINTGIQFGGRGFKIIGACDYWSESKCKADPDRSATVRDEDLTHSQVKTRFTGRNLVFDKKCQSGYAVEEDNFYSFETVESVEQKVKLAQLKGLRGVFIWEIMQDSADFELTRAIYNLNSKSK